ncbi:hypothetical protein D3C71_615200 [compost metagenome]
MPGRAYSRVAWSFWGVKRAIVSRTIRLSYPISRLIRDEARVGARGKMPLRITVMRVGSIRSWKLAAEAVETTMWWARSRVCCWYRSCCSGSVSI